MGKSIEQRISELEETLEGIVNGAPGKTRASKREDDAGDEKPRRRKTDDDTDPDIDAVLRDDDEPDGDDDE